MNRRVLVLVAVVCLLPVSAIASGPPKLSGNYAFSLNQYCQVAVGTDTFNNIVVRTGTVDADGDFSDGTTSLASVFDKTVDDGKISLTTAKATFNSTSGTVVMSGLSDKGSVLLVQGLSDPSENLAEVPSGGTLNFSNTASTLTINGLTWNVAYGNIVSGIAHYVTFTGIDSQKPGCADQGFAVRQ